MAEGNPIITELPLSVPSGGGGGGGGSGGGRGAQHSLMRGDQPTGPNPF